MLRVFCAVCSLAGCVFALPITAAEAPQPAMPNVLFIAVDDLRPELGCYGNPVVKTPHFDRIAARGMVFNRAYCQQAVCSPSRTSLLTGRRPDATQVYDLRTHFRAALPDAVTLPQYFKQRGYHCAALGKIYHPGFEDEPSWSEPQWYPRPARASDGDPERMAAPKTANRKGAAFEVSTRSDDELPDGMTAVEAVRRLRAYKQKGQPFFLAVGFMKPHLPFIAPKQYWDLYDPEKIPRPAIGHLPEGAPEFAGHNNGELHGYTNVPQEDPIPEDFARQLRHGYYACTSFTDAQVGRLLAALAREGLADNTVIVVWGDHGWQLGDHGLWHKHTNFEHATRSPLLISVPGQKTAGAKCSVPVEFLDIYPTLADVCGLSVPAGLDGVSLKPWLENPSTPMRKVAISQYPRNLGSPQIIVSDRTPAPEGRRLMGYSIRDERWRLTLWRDRTTREIVAIELYDEENDPAETVNLSNRPEHREVVARLARQLPRAPAAPLRKR